MTIKDQISADMKEAMRAKDQVKVDTLRAAMSAITYKKAESGGDLSEEDELAVLQKQVKQRNDSIAEYTKAGRTELADKEAKEKEILARYLPAQKSPEEIKKILHEIIESLDVSQRNQGNIMKLAMPKLKGLADGNVVKQLVAEVLK
jgi:uncharacterized protein YqeY